MNFLGMGPGELIMIAAVGLLIFGPGKLPEIAAQVGKAVRDFRRSTTEISSEFRGAFSLESAPPPPAPAGPAAPFATNGAATTDAPVEQGPTPAGSEPALVDTTEWHWETSGEAGDGGWRPAEATAESTFWQWDAPEASAPAQGAEATAQAASTDGSLWQWDTTDTTLASGEKTGTPGSAHASETERT